MEIISRSKAKEKELKKYFTGKPCKRGHLVERLVSNGNCLICFANWQIKNPLKPCRTCGAIDRNKRGACKPCDRFAKIAWKLANSEYYKINAEKIKAQKRGYMKNYYKANSEKVKIKTKIWKEANPEGYQKWSKNNPEALRIAKHNYRARKKINGGKLSKGLTEILYKKQKGKCICCKQPLGKDYHLDHIMPLALGGKNEDWNMQLLRAHCNQHKNARHPVEYMQSKGFLL